MRHLGAFTALLFFTASSLAAAAMPDHPRAGAACSASSVLNSIGDALTGGKDSAVLAAALDGEKHLSGCGNEHDAIGAELIAADAYGDVNQPQARCKALHDAATRAAKLGETERTKLIARAQRSCGK